jgi:hypothetical protein
MTTTVPAYTFGGITRPALILDDTGHIVLFGAAADFAATYGLKALYAGLPPGTPYPPVTDSLSTPVDSNGGANSVAEGAPANTAVGVTASASSATGTVTYSLVGDNSGGGFKINATTGVVTVNDPTKIDFESSPGHAYTITVQASDGIVTSTQNFNIAVTDVAPSAPTDTNAGANTVTEGAPSGTAVGVTAHSTDVNGGAVTYSLTGDTSGGGFKIDANTGVVTVNDATKIDFESSAPSHTYTVTVQASDGTLNSTTQTFTINVADVPLPAPTDTDATANSVAEGAAAGTHVGITASAIDPNGPTTHYSLIGDTSGGGFTIDPNTGVVTVADPTKIDFESTAPGHTYSITVQANDGVATTSQSFTIGVSDVAPSAPVDSNAAANSVVEGAAAGTTVGVTAHSTDINGGAVTYSLIGDTSGGGFTINAATGVVTVADSTKIDFETAPGHAYTETVQASDGTLTSSQTFTIGVTDVAPSTPVDSDATANTVVEGAAAGTHVGITASSTDVNGPAVTYSLTGDTSGGGFTINATTGVVTVADPTKIDFESTAPGHTYTVTATASDGTDTSSQSFTIGVTDAPPSVPVDSDATANSVLEGAAAGTTVGVTAHSTDVNGPAVTYSLTGDTSGGGFTINATTGVVTVADPTKIDFESAPGHAYTETVQASDGTQTSSQTFTIGVADVPPSTPVDANAAANTVVEGAANGSTVGITASSTDVNGPAVTYSLIGDTSGGGFTINAATGVVTVADSTKIDFESSGAGHSYTITAQASDGTDTSQQTFTIGVTDAPPSTPVDSDATANSVAEGSAAGTTVGVTASSIDVNGPPVTYSLIGDTSGGGFTINATTGVVTVADPTKIDFESTAPGHSYTVTAQASDGTDTASQTFTIGVSDVPPSTPVDADATTNSVIEGAANGSTVGVTASSTDVNGPAVTYSLTGDTSGGGFTINATTGVVTVADHTKIDFESTAPGHTYTVTATASDGTDTSSQTFTINVTDAPPSTPVDSDGAANQVAVSSPNGTYVGVTASSTDVNGPAVTYSLTGDTSGGGFTVDPSTGKVTVADTSKILAADPSYDVTVQASDGTDTSQQTFTVNVVLDSAPVVTAGHTLNYTENQVATAIDPALTVTDSDNANLAHATVQITGNYANGEDILGFTNQNGITGSFNAATGTLTLTGSSSVANYQTALESVTYFDNSDNPSGAPRTVTIIANDGTLDSTAVTDTVNVTPVNDPPVVTAGHTLNYTENQVATAIDTAITVSDVDNTNLASATVQITGNYANGQDILGFTDQNGITGSFNAATGTLTLTGSSSVANYQTALDSVTYFDNSDNPSGAPRTVTIIANDGTANSTSVTDTINVTPVNDAPVTTAGGTLNYTENQAATVIDSSVTVTDVDNANMASATVAIGTGFATGQDVLDANVTGTSIGKSYNAATGVLTLTGSDTKAHYQQVLDSVTYFNSSDNPSGADRTINYTVNDGALNSNTSTSTVHVTPVNDAPVVTATGTLAYTEDNGAITVAPALTVTDVDSANLASATVQISANYVNGEDVLAFTNTASITGSFNAATGTMTLTGTDTVAHYQTALESVTYTDTSENPSTAARTVTFTADDGQAVNHQSAGSNHTITVASVDDAPTVTVPGAQDSVSAHTDFAITGISTNDVDAGSLAVKVSLGTTHGNITLDLSGGATLADATTNGTHSVHITGTLTQVNAALSSVVYHGDAGFTGADQLTVQTNDLGHTGTGGPLSSSVATVDIGVIPKVWFIDNTASAAGEDGTSAHPFHSIAAFNAVNDGGTTHPQTGDYIYLKTGTGIYSETDGIHLLNGQQLVGNGDSLTFPDPLNNANTLTIATAGTRPVIDVTGGAGNDAIHLAQNNTIHGFNVATENAAATGIADNGGTVGTLNISNMDVGVDPDGAGALSGNLGQAISITHGGTAGSMTFGTVNSGGGTAGIALGGPLATSFSATSGTLSGHSVSEFSDNGGSGTVSYGGTIGDGTGLSASITNRTAGTVTLSGNINDSNDSGGGIVVSNNSGGTIDFTGSTKTLNTGTSDAVSMTSNTGTTVDFTNGGLGITTTSGNGFSASTAGTYTVTGTGNTISTTSGTALNLSHVTVGTNGVTFASASTTSAGTGISIDTVSGGAINVNGGSISGATANGVTINAAQDNITIASSVTSTSTGHSVQVTNSGTSGGNTISFSGAVTDPGLGINLDNNDQNSGVATVNFSGGLNIDSTTHTGFNATNGGTFNVTNGANNSINTTTGTALNVANTTIGTSNITFHDISANGAVNGIVLNNTGSNGHLTVTGSGSVTAGGDNSGGTIQNTSGAGILLTNTTGPSFNNMNINTTVGSGISGTGVVNFSFTNGSIDRSGLSSGLTATGSTDTSNIAFDQNQAGVVSNVSGTVTITNNNLTNQLYHGVDIWNTSGTLADLNISNNTITSTSSTATDHGSGIRVIERPTTTSDTTVTKAELNSNTITVINGPGIQFQGGTGNSSAQVGTYGSSSSNPISIDSNTISGFNTTTGRIQVEGIVALVNGQGTAHFDVSSNHVSDTLGTGIELSSFGNSNVSAKVDNNVLNLHNIVASQGIGIGTSATYGVSDTPHLTFEANNNNISNTDGAGILAVAHDASGTMNATINSNTIAAPLSGNNFGIQVDSGNDTPSEHETVNLDITGNTTTGHGIDAGIGLTLADQPISGTESNTFAIKGLTPSPATDAQTSAYVSAHNTSSTGFSGTGTDILEGGDGGSGPSDFFIATAAGSPALPLLASPGGVQASTPTPGETHLTQAELNSVVDAAIAEWAAAGATPAQLALLHSITFNIADLSGNTISEESAPATITIDPDADGHGWFVDPTPSDNSEFTHAANASGTDLFTDPTSAAAGHLDLMTAVTHEMGHVLGLPDLTAASDANDLMYVNLVDGERRLPDATDVAQANTNALVVPGWTDHLSQGDSSGGGDNFNFTPPSTTTISVPAVGGAPASAPVPSPGLTAPAGDSFPWASAGESITFNNVSTAGSATVTLSDVGFHWTPSTDSTPASDMHNSVVVNTITTVHDTTVDPVVSAILPDPHVLAATVPSIGGYLVH